ncbi:DUF3455 domain-containing protein [Crenobacter cavernae]|uniref:DUF3455 domain-containing protein n=1 Tax=Crenobacter cavernae TaxID=2290923 RepID=A0A345Y667_9NEIS|nr:DUF3455 domain-containing protein [Crenobacter cavernae]AXK39419.1 DUF3455 domain-containing protein [Crenobacter cavernae]
MKKNTLISVLTIASLPAMAAVDNAQLPENIRVPGGHVEKLQVQGEGKIIYVCSAKAGAPGQYEWTLLQPQATLYNAQRQPVGQYYAGPRWDLDDGSQAVGKPVAGMTAQGGIPLQLVKIDETRGEGALRNTSYVQRLGTQGGLPPTSLCDKINDRAVEEVPYKATYVFYQPSKP